MTNLINFDNFTIVLCHYESSFDLIVFVLTHWSF